jgi:DNA-binding NarL/FixJ family response regulator
MSSQLLADALVLNRSYEAAAISASDLMKSMGLQETTLVVIGADLEPASGSGFDLAELVSRAYPQTGIVVLLDKVTRISVISAFRSGARGVFSRKRSMNAFLECIDYVHRGCIWAGQRESAILLEALRNIPAPAISAASSVQALSARELQVVQRAAQGKTDRTISHELNLSEHTVKNYLSRAFEKLGGSGRIELLFYLTVKGYTFSELDGAVGKKTLQGALNTGTTESKQFRPPCLG